MASNLVHQDGSIHEGSLEVFDYSIQMHKASLVGLHSIGLLDSPTVSRIGRAIEQVVSEHEAPESPDSVNYLNFESLMVAAIGPEASLLHLGRSRQDILSTLNRQVLRKATIGLMQDLLLARSELLTLARRHAATIIPTYTHGVPAQPTTYGHYLLAFSEALERSHERFLQSYARVNLSPFGVSVSTTSRFPLDRPMLASLLGFDGVEENAYGANHIASMDAVQDATSPLSTLTLTIGLLVQDMTQVHATSRQWLTIREGPLTGTSSAMPQKRNPRVLEYLREMASEVLGGVHMVAIISHNCTTGLTDTRETISKLPLDTASRMLKMLASLFPSVAIDAEQALDEASRDYSTSTEIADILYDTHKIPFRTGHHFASKLADYGRQRRLSPMEIPFRAAQQIYEDVAPDGSKLPLSMEDFASALSPVHFVESRKGLGGPQKAEMDRMLAARGTQLEHDRRQVEALLGSLKSAEGKLQNAFAALL